MTEPNVLTEVINTTVNYRNLSPRIDLHNFSHADVNWS